MSAAIRAYGLPAHYLCLPSSCIIATKKHTANLSLHILAYFGLLALARYLSRELLGRGTQILPGDATVSQPLTAQMHPFFSILVPMTLFPGTSTTFYVLQSLKTVGVMVPGLDLLTIRPLGDICPSAYAIGKWITFLFRISEKLAYLLILLSACGILAIELRILLGKQMTDLTSPDISRLWWPSEFTALRVFLGASSCLLGYVISNSMITLFILPNRKV